MSSRSVPLLLAALVAPMVALPAAAQTAAGWADSMIKKKLVAPGDRVWLQPLELKWSAADVQLMDDLTSALLARKVAVVRDLTFPGPAPEDREPLEHLKGLGVSKVLSYTRARDDESANFRVIEIPSGLVVAVETISAKGEPDKATIAETPVRPTNYARALGLSASNLSGSGLTYRRWFENDWGVQVAGIPFVTVTNNLPSGFVNLGLQGMMPFFKGERVRLYGLLGVGAAYSLNRYSTYVPGPGGADGSMVTTTTDRWDLGIAPGIGLDYLFFNNLAVTTAVGYTVGRTSGSQQDPSWSLSPGGSIGVLVYW